MIYQNFQNSYLENDFARKQGLVKTKLQIFFAINF